MLVDDSFQVPSSQARIAVETALQLRAWINGGQNRNVYEKFFSTLFESLNAFLKDPSRLKKKICGGPFINCKHQLILKHSGTAFFPTVTFYQHITMVCFKGLIKVTF